MPPGAAWQRSGRSTQRPDPARWQRICPLPRPDVSERPDMAMRRGRRLDHLLTGRPSRHTARGGLVGAGEDAPDRRRQQQQQQPSRAGSPGASLPAACPGTPGIAGARSQVCRRVGQEMRSVSQSADQPLRRSTASRVASSWLTSRNSFVHPQRQPTGVWSRSAPRLSCPAANDPCSSLPRSCPRRRSAPSQASTFQGPSGSSPRRGKRSRATPPSPWRGPWFRRCLRPTRRPCGLSPRRPARPAPASGRSRMATG